MAESPVESASSADQPKKQSRWNVAPLFLVDDVVASANFYRDKLGFEYDRFWGEPPCFCMVHRSGIVIMLNQIQGAAVSPNGKNAPDGECWDAYIWVDNADALFTEFQAKGVKIARNICDQEYGCRDFDIEDFNGYRICFGHTTG